MGETTVTIHWPVHYGGSAWLEYLPTAGWGKNPVTMCQVSQIWKSECSWRVHLTDVQCEVLLCISINDADAKARAKFTDEHLKWKRTWRNSDCAFLESIAAVNSSRKDILLTGQWSNSRLTDTIRTSSSNICSHSIVVCINHVPVHDKDMVTTHQEVVYALSTVTTVDDLGWPSRSFELPHFFSISDIISEITASTSQNSLIN